VVITRKAMHENNEFSEVFVPELCHLSGYNHLINSELWMKAIFLPSILQRTAVLLNADDLRSSINKECHIGSDQVTAWQDFVALSQPTIPESAKKSKAQGFGLPKFTCKVPEVNKIYCPWSEEEPVDPDYFLDQGVSWGQIEEYASFAFTPLSSTVDSNNQQQMTQKRYIDKQNLCCWKFNDLKLSISLKRIAKVKV